MKYWENVSTQEQRTLKRGLIVIVLMVLVRFVWWPLYDGIDQKEDDIATEVELIAWMKPTVDLLKSMKEPVKPIDQSLPHLSTIEKSFVQAGLKPYITNIAQNANQQVVLQAKSVPFGALALCLETIAKTYGIIPLSLTAVRQKTGIVDVEIVF